MPRGGFGGRGFGGGFGGRRFGASMMGGMGMGGMGMGGDLLRHRGDLGARYGAFSKSS